MNPVKLEAHIPDEPPVGSVVIDERGHAWQRLHDGDYNADPGVYCWYPIAFHRIPGLFQQRERLSWRELLAQGNVTLVHNSGEDQPSEQPASHLYRVRKPLEARQWLPGDDGGKRSNEIANWLNVNDVNWDTEGVGRDCMIVINDPSASPGRLFVKHGGWIIKGITGSFFATDPQSFDATCMAVTE